MKKSIYVLFILCLFSVIILAGCGGGGSSGGGNNDDDGTDSPLITTIAGTGIDDYNGDNIAATTAQLDHPNGVAVDSFGNVYIADTNNNRIRKVDLSGNITTLAGTGDSGYNGDNIEPTTAQLLAPNGVAVDTNGNIYIAECHRIRKIEKFTGKISTIAGTADFGYNGDDIDAITAQLLAPKGVAVDNSGNVYIADSGNNRIRKIDITNNKIYTIAGTNTTGYNGDDIVATTAELDHPNGVAVDSFGNVYIADSSNNRIRKIDKTTGKIYTIAGTITGGYNGDNIDATTAQLSYPNSVFVDPNGNVFITDCDNARVRKIDTSGNITTIAGTGTNGYNGDNIAAITAQLDEPSGIAVDSSGIVYIADLKSNRIRKVK